MMHSQTPHGRLARRALLLLVVVVIVVAGCSSVTTPGQSPGGGSSAPTAAARATPRATTSKPTPKPTPFPAAGVKWLKAYCPAAKQFLGIVSTYQQIQGDMASFNFGDIQPRATKLLTSVVTLEALVKKIPNWGPGAKATSSLTAALAKLHMAGDMFRKAFNGNLPDLGALAAAAQTGVDGLGQGAEAAKAMADLAVVTGRDCDNLI